MAKCDLCGKHCKANELKQLLSTYQLPEVVDLCRDCATFADEAKVKELEQVSDRVRARLADRYQRFHSDESSIKPHRFRFITTLKGLFQ